MKCLSVRESWAYYIVAGLKDVENRQWKTDYRGSLAIHCSGVYDDIPNPLDAGKNRLPVGIDYFRVAGVAHKAKNMGEYWQKEDDGKVHFKFLRSEPQPEMVEREFVFWDRIFTNPPPYCPVKCVIGTVDIVDIIRDSKSIWAEPGQYHWILENPVWFKNPIPTLGKLGLFEIDDKILEKVGD